jgi:ATP-dependent DNA helicase RecQ
MAKRRLLKNILETREEDGATIIYCRTKPEVAEVYQFLLRQKFQNVYMYHGAAGSCDKNFAVENFQSKHAPIMVATSAFGM